MNAPKPTAEAQPTESALALARTLLCEGVNGKSWYLSNEVNLARLIDGGTGLPTLLARQAVFEAVVAALHACSGYFIAIDAMQPDKKHGTLGNLVREQTRSALALADQSGGKEGA